MSTKRGQPGRFSPLTNEERAKRAARNERRDRAGRIAAKTSKLRLPGSARVR